MAFLVLGRPLLKRWNGAMCRIVPVNEMRPNVPEAVPVRLACLVSCAAKPSTKTSPVSLSRVDVCPRVTVLLLDSVFQL